MSKVIERRTIPTTGVRVEVVETAGGEVYAEETKEGPYGTMSRRSVRYASLAAYDAAEQQGKVRWNKWI